MRENLVIVESPAKAKTIEKFLGSDFVVKSSFGHIRDLAKKDLGVNVDGGFNPIYEVPTDKRKVVDELKKLAAEAKTVWLASDEDREGEAIAWHLTEVLGLPVDQTKRIVFHEITKRAILAAVDNPRTVNIDLVNAQQARRVLDRLVGFELSPVLWKKVRPQLSAGRVQSVAVRLLVEREREIIGFNSTPYWRVVGIFNKEGDKSDFKAELSKRFESEEEAQKIFETLPRRILESMLMVDSTQYTKFPQISARWLTSSKSWQLRLRPYGSHPMRTARERLSLGTLPRCLGYL